jgi:hypothetical protein
VTDGFLSSSVFRWLNQFEVTNAKGQRQLVKSNDRWISVALFEAADVLLAEARNIGELLLRQAPFLSKSPNVPADQSAHIHAQRSADYILEVYQL